jgi:hypothetical protein
VLAIEDNRKIFSNFSNSLEFLPARDPPESRQFRTDIIYNPLILLVLSNADPDAGLEFRRQIEKQFKFMEKLS